MEQQMRRREEQDHRRHRLETDSAKKREVNRSARVDRSFGRSLGVDMLVKDVTWSTGLLYKH